VRIGGVWAMNEALAGQMGRQVSVDAGVVGAIGLGRRLGWRNFIQCSPSIKAICASSNCSLERPNSARRARSSCNVSLSIISLSSATSLSRASTTRSSDSTV
jgi:hypothetical protein